MKNFYIFLFLFFPLQLFAGVGDHDNRYYVTDEMWATEPYKKFVKLTTIGESWDAWCSAQYVSPNLILSAGHCTDPEALRYKVENYKYQNFDVKLIKTYYANHRSIDSVGDWAVWLVTDPEYYSDAYFDILEPVQSAEVINAGWGWARIIDDKELPLIRTMLEEIRKEQNKAWVNVNQVRGILSTKMSEKGMEPIYDNYHRLKASQCRIVLEDCEKMLNMIIGMDKPIIIDKEISANLPKTQRQNAMEKLFNTHAEKFAYMCDNRAWLSHKETYPYVLGTTCDTWGGNSGGGYISPDGKYLYGVCSAGNDTFEDSTTMQYMTSAKQFREIVKDLIKQYDSKHPAEKNIAQIPENFLQPEPVTDLGNKTEQDGENLEHMSYRVDRRIQELSAETKELDTKLMAELPKVKDMTDAQLLSYLNKMVEHQVKSEQLEKLEKAYRDARDKEQSTANKALTAAAVAAGGLGGMEWAQGAAEQRADAAAEREMSAYIATMKCEYGGGQQVNLGAEETLPGGNEMLSYKTEFKQLAEKLKATKTALNLRPGIESEVIYDRVETGLYDYQTAETGGGANPSLSRALMNPDGTDAAAWNAQKQESADKAQGGRTATGIGVIGGAVGNAAINTDVIKNVVEKIRR